jgi:hypothetical protein
MEQHKLHFRAINHYPSCCAIRIYRQSGIVVATDINQGASVTNASDIIANEVVRQFGVKPQRMIFIEEYRPGGPDHTTDLVQFDFADGKVFRNPRWTHIPEPDFNRMIQIAEEVESMV